MKKNNKIKPIWEHYNKWECFQNDMYKNGNNKEIIQQCYEILTKENLKEEMYDTTITYEIATKVMFTNQMFNPISWLGQATCNRLINATVQEVCEAWMAMTKEQQEWANTIAKEVIENWRKNYESLQ